MTRVARTYRFEPDLVVRLEAEAARLGQSHTTFVTRAVEKALGSVPEPDTSASSRLPRPIPVVNFKGRRMNVSVAPGQSKGTSHHPKCACGVCKPPKS